MMEFLSFNRLISIEVLITFYYLGVLVLPLLLVWLYSWLKQYVAQKVPSMDNVLVTTSDMISESLSFSIKIKLTVICSFFFILAELFWRLLFEFLIAFMQMRDALVLIQ